MASPPLPDPARCGCRVGLIFVRPCQGPPITACSQCRTSLCVEHRRPYGQQVLCPDCYARLRPDSDTLDSDRSHSTATSSYSGDAATEDVFTGQGGAFGGGGASGGWSDEAATATTDALLESPFSAEDYAAFDAVSDYDRSDEKGGGYDS
ncbi:MAG: hypothetical protein FIA97_15380 [Methylococcaceae bacterium]|nr:hypothetical protein [Methylococcaceae bacterium]